MATNLLSLDAIVEPMRGRIEGYFSILQAEVASNLKSVTLFGAIAAGTFEATRHTVRNVIEVDKVDLNVLHRLSEQGAKLGRDLISAPLVMTRDYIKSSLDTFPLELLEIAQMHVTVFGDDPFADLSFEAAHVRLQCERELKALLVGLRQGLLAAAGRQDALGSLERDVGLGLLRTMRGLLWLGGEKDGKPAGEVIAKIEKLTERELTGTREAVNPDGAHGWDQFVDLYADVQALAEYADGL